MTKEEIVTKETFGIFDEYELGITGLSKAMDEYAKQEAIAFLKWCIKSSQIGLDDQWYMVIRNNDQNLWNEYQQSLNNK